MRRDLGSGTANKRGAAAITALVAALALLALPALPARAAQAKGVGDLPPVTDAQLRASVHDITLPVADITLSVADVDTTTTDGDQTVVSLNSDVLFTFGKAELPPSAAAKIGTLVRKAPRKARVQVLGHTDSIGSTASNRALSVRRARAVAAAIGASRPDLRLDARGFGESRPVASNTSGGKDDPQGRAKNRRVEIRYDG